MSVTGAPLKTWIKLGLAVLLAHLLLLSGVAVQPGPDQASDTTLHFSTRTVVVAAQQPAAQSEPAPQARTRPRPRTSTPPARHVPKTASPAPGPAATTPTPPGPGATDADGNVTDTPDTGKLAEAPAPPPDKTDPEAGPDEPPAPETPAHAPAIEFKPERLAGSVKLLYSVQSNKFPYSLHGELQWQRSDDRYQARMAFSAFGQTRSQTSRGLIGPGGLTPERFGDKYRSEVAAHFNYAQGKVTFSANTPDLPLMAGAQDRLSVLVQLGALAASQPDYFEPGATLSIQTVGPRAGDLWQFTVEKSELLDLPGGQQQGLKLVRRPRELYDQRIEIWLAPGLAYLPARVRITERNGDYVDQKWQASEAADPLP